MRELIIECNSALCLKCGEELESKSRHDFRTCSCGSLSVDGGKDYIRRLYREDVAWRDTSIEKEKDEHTTESAGS